MRTNNPTFRNTLALFAAAIAVAALSACDTGGPSVDTAAPPPAPATSVSAETDAPPAELCGQARGPEGSLNVNILADSAPVECTEVMRVANLFGPKIALTTPGGKTRVEAWNCELPSVPDMLARCEHDGQRFGMFIAY